MPDTVAGPSSPPAVQPPTITWVEPGQTGPAALTALPCPNCGSADSKAVMLRVEVRPPGQELKRLHVLRCPACDCRFYDVQVPPDYAEPALNERGRVPFYVQQGAGVSLITKPLAQAPMPRGSAYMEVGCGFGFGLDYALNTRGWHGVGIDPAPLSALGRDVLGLPIELRYLRDDDEARGTRDVVLGSEVIEHVTSPSAFVRTLRAMLRPGGLLILTTPNGDDIDRAMPPGIIVPLLSPSLHLVIQTRRSLEWLLRAGGFAHVEVGVDSHSLVAFASDAPLHLERDEGRLRAALRRHLCDRAERFDQGSDMFLGFAGRALQECVNDGDDAGADKAFALLALACRERFGLELDKPDLPPELAYCSLERMVELVPLNLGGILYARGIRRLALGEPRAGLEGIFAAAATAAAAMRRALGELAMEDGQTEDIGWTAAAEALICAAEAGAADLPARLHALPPAPEGGVRRRRVAQRALGALVNAGHHSLAHTVAAQEHMHEPPPAPLSDADRDMLFSLAVLDVQGDANLPRAAERFAAVRRVARPGSPLWQAAYAGERQARIGTGDEGMLPMTEEVAVQHPEALGLPDVIRFINAGRHDLARSVLLRTGLDRAPWADPGRMDPLTTEERDNLFFLAVLDAQIAPEGGPAGEPALARMRFARVRAATPPGTGLWWAALGGEFQALDLLDLGHDAVALVHEVQAAHPTLPVPDSLQERFALATQ